MDQCRHGEADRGLAAWDLGPGGEGCPAPRKLHGLKPPADRWLSSPFFPLLHPQLGPSLYCLRSLSSVPLQAFRDDSEA